MEKNVKINKPVEYQETYKDFGKQNTNKKPSFQPVGNVKNAKDLKVTSKIKNFFEQKSGKIQ